MAGNVRPERPSFSLRRVFAADRRDRRPGTHFAAELGSPPRVRRKRLPPEIDPHVDEDLGTAAYGIDWSFVKK
jgi:hypothetical protein